MKYFYVKRLKDGATLDIPERDLEGTLSLGGFELIGPINLSTETPQLTQVSQDTSPVVNPVSECPLCQKVFASDRGLKIHKNSHV